MRKYILFLIVTGFIMACTDHEKEKAGDNKMTEKEVAEFIKHYDDLWAKKRHDRYENDHGGKLYLFFFYRQYIKP